MKRIARLVLAAGLVVPAFAQDVSVSELGRFQNSDDYIYWGQNPAGTIAAYSIATTSCNVGNVPVDWRPQAKTAPVIGTNMFRIVDGRIEQLGYSFAKYAFCAFDAQGGGCPGSCMDENSCDRLGVNCADTYWADLNDGKDGGAKWEVNPTTAKWPAGPPSGPGNGPNKIVGRLQVNVDEVADPFDDYIAEGQYLSPPDHEAGNSRNNYAWRKIAFTAIDNVVNAGPTNMGDPAIYAWQALANDVLITEVPLEDEGGAGIHGWYFLGSRAIDLGGGLWRYEYALQNGNSNRSAGSFSVNVPCDGNLSITDPYFHDVRPHSGTPFSGVDWTLTQSNGSLSWATDDFATDPNANAIRWGTLYNFGFTANRAPTAGTSEIGIFMPGSPDSLFADVIAPAGEFTGYCSANPNSTGSSATISAVGSPYVEIGDLVLAAGQLPVSSFGYFLMSASQDFVPNFGGSQGNLCLGAPQVRFDKSVLKAGATGTVEMVVDFDALPQGVVFQPGESWNFQYWYRDSNPTATSNTTLGVNVVFCQ